MKDAEFKEFAADLDAAFSLYGKKPDADQKGLFFRALKDYPLRAVKAGLEAHMRDPQRGRFAPLPADVVAHVESMVQKQDGRPGVEEAWALALRSADEAETVVWTAEMAQAWEVSRACLPDEVAARMAFKETYARITAEARSARAPAQWTVSLGHDPQRRELAVSQAVTAGRLPAIELERFAALPAPRDNTLLALEYASDAPEKARAALRRLRESLVQRADAPSVDVAEKQRTQQLKELTAARVAALVQQEQAREEA